MKDALSTFPLARITISIGLFVILPGEAFACSCMRGPEAPLPPYVVEARVISVETGRSEVRARLRVLRSERGKIGRRIVVATPASSAACGIGFQTGEVRRLGLSRHQGRYSANLCQQIAIEQHRP